MDRLLDPAPTLPAVPRALAGPIRRADLAAVPPDWRVGPPDFVGLGCGKAGTTWWWTLLEGHPQVVQNRVGEKELHHFSHFDLRGPSAEDLAVYGEAFAAPPGAISGDFTCTFLTLPLSLEWLHRAAPQTRCLVMLRDPIERTASAFDMYRRGRATFFGLEGDRAHALEAFSLFPEAVQGSAPAAALERACALFGRERVLVLQYEACVLDPERHFRRTLEFLGIDPEHRPEAIARSVNARPDRAAGLDPDQRVALAHWFRRDVEHLARLVPDLDLTLWPDFA